MMTPEEIGDFDVSLASTLRDVWGEDAGAPFARDLDRVWASASDEGWLELDGDLDALVRVARACGRRAVPLAAAEAVVLRRLRGDLADEVATGRVRPVLCSADEPPIVDGGGLATHALRLTEDGASLAPITRSTPQDGVAAPAWHTVELDAAEDLDPSPEDLTWARSVLRLCLSARALGAAGRSLELATEHTTTRHQFGRPIGSFGAIQQRIAALTIDFRAAELLIAEAAGAVMAGRDDAPLAAELAAEHVGRTAQDVQFGSQHTLGAIGYFDEAPSPWLFRRVQADLAWLNSTRTTTVADHLVEGDQSLPAFTEDDDLVELRRQIRQVFQDEGIVGKTRQSHVDDPTAVESIARAGYFGLTLPKEFGGQDLGTRQQVALIEEMGYQRVSAYNALNAVLFLGKAIEHHGDEAQRAQFLPMMRDGELRFCLGYSEPETGSDLAALRTRATRSADGDWIVNGQKTWTTRAHRSDWMWLAARTDPDPSLRHRGITVFMLPMQTAGIEIHEHRSQAGEISCTVFLDDVRIPDALRIGGINEGWKVINTALAGERASMAAVTASMHRQLDDLLTIARDDASVLGPVGSAQRALVSQLSARLQGARVLVRDAVDAINEAGGSRLEAPMAAIAGGELAVDFSVGMMHILGPRGLLGADADAPVSHGGFSHALLMASKSVIGGGTNDILRGLVARGLGLPR